MEALGINLGYLLVQIFNFAILFVVLRAWVFKPIVGLLETRRERVAQGLEDARVAAEARENAEQDAQKIIAEAQKDAGNRLREATERAEQTGREIRMEAEREANEIRETARAEAEQAKQVALGELRTQISALALAAAQKVIEGSLDEQRQHALIDEFFSGVRSGRVVLLAEEKLQGNHAQITSALPLTEAEMHTVSHEILSKLSSSAKIDFRVDPTIMGGLVIRVGDRVLDGSVAGKLENLRQTLR